MIWNKNCPDQERCQFFELKNLANIAKSKSSKKCLFSNLGRVRLILKKLLSLVVHFKWRKRLKSVCVETFVICCKF